MSKAIQLKNRSGEKVYPCPYYPVGSIYLSVNNTNPGTIFGGTWEQIKDRFLLACGSTYSNGSTGGSTNHRHDFRVGFEQFYGLFIGDTLENQGAYSYSQGKYSKSYGRNSGTTGVVANNNISYTSTKNVSDYIRYSDGDTQTASSLPPYLAIYVWKRVS
jgi:hypothetical protein